MEEVLLAELTENCTEKRERLIELLKTFDLACLGYDLQEQHSKDIHNRVLQEHEFFCSREFSRDTGIKAGDRITDEDYLFLLSEEDFGKVMELARPIAVEEKLTDEKGYFLEDWVQLRGDARRELVDFILDEIVPKFLRMQLEVCRNSIVWSDKLIDALKKSFKKAA